MKTTESVAPTNLPERPKSANAMLRSMGEYHDYIKDPIDMTTTGGIQRAIERNWQAIQALADYVDGVVRGPDGVVRDKNGQPVQP